MLPFLLCTNLELMKQPPYLKQGDTIRIISSARKISREELLPSVSIFQDWGLNVEFGKNLFKKDNQFAGTEEERVQDLQEAINDEKVKAIIFARGGYGSVQLVDQIDWSYLSQNPKWLVGYSDVTVFHSHINRNLGIESIHAAMPVNIKEDNSGLSNAGLKSLKDALFGSPLSYTLDNSADNTVAFERLESELIGGNLSILYSLCGSKSQIETKDKILFIEDLDEYLYHIDRMMMNLIRSGQIAECKAILVGGMSDMNDNTIPFGRSAIEIIKHRTAKLNVPCIFGFPAGHIIDNRALILGRRISLEKQDDMIKVKFYERAQ